MRSREENNWQKEHTRAPMAAGIPTVRAMAVYDFFPSVLPNPSRVALWYSVGWPFGNSTSTSWCRRTMSWSIIDDDHHPAPGKLWAFIICLQMQYHASYLLCARIGQPFFHAVAGNIECTLAWFWNFCLLLETQKSDWIRRSIYA